MMRLEPSVTDSSRCRHCGSHVSDDFRRTFGDEDSVVYRCPSRDSRARIQAGSAAGLDVAYPDPSEQPGRNREPRVGIRSDEGLDG